MSHSPLPFVAWQGQSGPVVVAVGRPAIDKGLMAAIIIWFYRKDIHKLVNFIHYEDMFVQQATWRSGAGMINLRVIDSIISER